jgi:hypothetical protein
MGCYGHCGMQEIPIIMPIAGVYNLAYEYHGAILNYPFNIVTPGDRIEIDFSKMPLNTEICFKIYGFDGMPMEFTVDGDICPTGNTDCFDSFSIKINYHFTFQNTI